MTHLNFSKLLHQHINDDSTRTDDGDHYHLHVRGDSRDDTEECDEEENGEQEMVEQDQKLGKGEECHCLKHSGEKSNNDQKMVG